MSAMFVAEVSSNHNQDLERCLDFVDTAADIGCDAIKFQLFKMTELFHPSVIEANSKIQRRVEWELPESFLPHIADRAHSEGIKFGCSPFSLNAVEKLEPYVSFYKIASYELLWDELLEACAKTGKPVVLSTGMANVEEVANAIDTLQSAGCSSLTVLHCVSSYPVKPKNCNLSAIGTLRQTFECDVGWSDHSAQPGVIHRAIHQWKSSMIEFHMDLSDKDGYEDDTAHSWTPSEIEKVIRDVSIGFDSDGRAVKEPSEAEREERNWRADPEDGLRPLKKIREEFNE